MITVDFDPKSVKLVMKVPFHMADIPRGFPSRRFDPKTKTWKIPLTKLNAEYLRRLKHCDIQLTIQASGALKDLEKLTAGPVYLDFPMEYFEGHKYKPLPHQPAMLNFGWNLKSYALIAAMGTGKTFTTIALALARWQRGQIKRLTIICPSTLKTVWIKEFRKYCPDPEWVDVYNHANNLAYVEWARQPSKKLKVLLVSVEGLGVSETLADSVHYFFDGGYPMMCVVDESTRIKKPDRKRTKRTIEIGSRAHYRMILNGTPVSKSIQDLWSQFEFLEPNIIGSGDYWAFKTRYVVMGGYEGKQIIGYQNVDELMRKIRPYALEVNKSVLDLPPKLYKQIDIKPTADQERLFTKILTGIGEGPAIKAQNVLERMLRLQQVIGGFEPTTDWETEKTTCTPLASNPKFDALMEVIEDHYEGSKFIIWARFIPEIELLIKTLREKYGDDSTAAYYGATSAEARSDIEDQYCNDPKLRFFVGNPAAAGLGLTLISGESDIMVYYSGTFAYVDRAQSEDRAHRIGQKNTVTILDLVMEGTLDVAIAEAIAQKKGLDEYVKEQIAAGRSVVDLARGRAA